RHVPGQAQRPGALRVLRSRIARPGGVRRSEVDREAAVAEGAERVVAVQPGEHVPGLLGPGHRVGSGGAPNDLRVAALVDAVLAPAPGVVLRARDLDERRVTRDFESADAVAVRVAGEVAGDVLVPGDDRRQLFAVVGVDAEVPL